MTSCDIQILDDITLTNLDVVDTQGRPAGTLLHRIDHTVTAFGTFMLLHHTPHTHTPPQASVGCVSGCVHQCVTLSQSVLIKRLLLT